MATLAPQGKENLLYDPKVVTGVGSLDPTITSESLSSTTPITPIQPATTPIPTVNGLQETVTPQPLTATPQETEISKLLKEIQGANTELTGKTAFQTGLEQKAGYSLDEQGKPVNQASIDLSNRLKALTNEALAIPQQLQLESTGRGITKAGLAPIETGRLRENAIAALGVSSLLAAQQNNLAYAQSLVRQAVQAKYGPEEEANKARLANLELLLKDPSLSLADKNRAAARKAIEDANATKIAKAKKDSEDAQTETLKYASVADAVTLSEMQKATNPMDVVAIAVRKGLITPEQAKQKLEQEKLKADIAKLNNPDLEFVPATTNQPAGVFNKRTGAFTPTGGGTVDGVKPAQAKEQVNLVLNSIKNAENLASASGRSGLRKTAEGLFVGSTKYTNLVAETNTLRTNVLTMMTDPAIKKFFGPQMSNADVQLMTSAGTTLNPELQSPQKMKEELGRLKDLAQRAKMSLDGVTQFGLTKDNVRVGVMPDGSIQDADGNKYDKNGNKI